jgi:flagellar biosynthesis regulator FlaF
MFDRVLWCVLGSALLWCGLVYLTSEDGRILNVIFWFDSVLATAVLILLLFVLVAPLLYLKCVSLPTHAGTLVPAQYADEHWIPTTVWHLEALKSELSAIEARADYLSRCDVYAETLRDANADALERWLVEQGIAILRGQYRFDASRANALRLAITRIYGGDVDSELLDYRDQLAELRKEHAATDATSIFSDRIDRKIRRCERNISELEAWRNKAAVVREGITAYERHEAAWQRFIDFARREAYVPIVEATSRMEAAFAGLEVKRRYERIVSEQLCRGMLSADEADFIRQKLGQEFMASDASIFA